jgi:PAS domain S-box-containing protein
VIASRHRIGRVIAGLGLAIGLTVAVAVPVGYLLVAYTQLGQHLSLLAELNATRVAKYIYTHRDLWQYHTLRLAEIIEIPEEKEVNPRQRVLDAAGKLVLETGEAPAWPMAARSVPILVAGTQVATFESSATYRDILVETGLVALFSSLLGFAIFLVVRTLPVRIIEQTLAELGATQARYRLLFDANPFPMVVVDRESLALLAVNDAATEHYGWSREEFLAMTIADLRPPGNALPSRMLELARDRTATGAATFSGQRHRKKDGTVIEVEITTRAIEFDGRPAALSLAIDVTERNRVEEQLRQSQKMEAIGQLTGGIAHDFNNILNVIMANIEALSEQDVEPTVKRRLGRIGGAVDRAVDLTRQLLSFSRKQPLRTEVTDINQLVTSTAKLLRRSLGPQVEIDTVLFHGLWRVKVDRPQLEAALVNLSVNARDAMPDGGKLLIETRNETLDEAYAAQDLDVRAGDYALLIVSDTGKGMLPSVLEHVFDPFFTTKEVGKGTGLGLSMVYGFVKQSKGHITVASEPGRGTTFRIYLPRTDDRIGQAGVRMLTEMPSGHERVLVVEDEADVRAATVEQLQSLGYEVASAGDGANALALMQAAGEPYELLLTDVMMPKLGGRALADVVALRWPQTRIVYMSGYAADMVTHDGIVDPGVLLLSKPFAKSELAAVVRQALDTRKVPAVS